MPPAHPLTALAERFHNSKKQERRAVRASDRSSKKTVHSETTVSRTGDASRASLEFPGPESIAASRSSQAPKQSKRTFQSNVSGSKPGNSSASKGDIFQQFIKESGMATAAVTSQDDILKRLHQTARQTKLDMMNIEAAESTRPLDEQLTSKTYTDAGHKIIMDALESQNASRSEPSLVRSAKKSWHKP